MADLLEKLWPAFVSEVTEQLDSVELLLARSGSAKSIDVNHLFRNFHTIKGYLVLRQSSNKPIYVLANLSEASEEYLNNFKKIDKNIQNLLFHQGSPFGKNWKPER